MNDIFKMSLSLEKGVEVRIISSEFENNLIKLVFEDENGRKLFSFFSNPENVLEEASEERYKFYCDLVKDILDFLKEASLSHTHEERVEIFKETPWEEIHEKLFSSLVGSVGRIKVVFTSNVKEVKGKENGLSEEKLKKFYQPFVKQGRPPFFFNSFSKENFKYYPKEIIDYNIKLI